MMDAEGAQMIDAILKADEIMILLSEVLKSGETITISPGVVEHKDAAGNVLHKTGMAILAERWAAADDHA